MSGTDTARLSQRVLLPRRGCRTSELYCARLDVLRPGGSGRCYAVAYHMPRRLLLHGRTRDP
eukprot:1346900-Rhodomonas_salina.1